MARTSFHIVKEWLLEALAQKGGRSGLHELVEYLETVKAGLLLPDDHLPQKGHPKDSQFKYYCRWAITTLRNEGKIRRGSPRGIVELEDSSKEIAMANGHSQEPHKEKSINHVIRTMIGEGASNEDIIAALRPVYRRKYGNEKSEQWLRNRVSAKIRYVKAGSGSAKEAPELGAIAEKSTADPLNRHRSLLAHLSRFGELTQREQQQLGLTDRDMSAWLDVLLLVRPHTTVVTPLFLWGIEGDSNPVRFTTRLAVRMTGEYLERAAKEPIESIEAYVWERFGCWHLAQPHPGESKWHGYLTVPVAEPADLAASEKLDLFAHLPPLIISELVRDTSFLNEQQTWSAQASMKGSLGPLSRQINLGVRRPLILSELDLPLDAEGGGSLGDLPESEVLTRVYVVAGLPLCTSEEWQQNLRLSEDELVERILAHPLYAAIVQFEFHRIMAKLSGELAASVHRNNDNSFTLEIDGGNSMPLWLACRALLEDLGFWPAADSTKDATWESAILHALGNLTTLGVLEDLGNEIHLTSQFASKIKAHPGHCQNRGEKSYRVRLAQYLEKLSRGAS